MVSSGCGKWSPRRMRRRMVSNCRSDGAETNSRASASPSLGCARGATLRAPRNPPAVTHHNGRRRLPTTMLDTAVMTELSWFSDTSKMSHGNCRHGSPVFGGNWASPIPEPRARRRLPEVRQTNLAPCCTARAAASSDSATTMSCGAGADAPHAAPFWMVIFPHQAAWCWHSTPPREVRVPPPHLRQPS